MTGSALFAFGLGWALMGVLSTRASAQPQAWVAVPAAFLGPIGLGLIVFQPGPAAMGFPGWVRPPASSHRVLSAATHTSTISGVDAPACVHAILDVVAALRTGTAVR